MRLTDKYRRKIGATRSNGVMPGALGREGKSISMKEGRSDIYFPGRVDDSGNKRKGDGEQKGERKEEIVRRICASAPDAASSLSSPPSCNPLFFRSIADGQEAAAQPRGRRGALCVSENVALIGGSVAVMRYQPPANKRINIKRWRWMRRRMKLASRTRVRG